MSHIYVRIASLSKICFLTLEKQFIEIKAETIEQ